MKTKETIIGYARIPIMEMGKNGALVSRMGSFPVFAELKEFEFPGEKLNRAKKRSKGLGCWN